MINLFRVLLLITLLLNSEKSFANISRPLHDFYLSICEINYNANTRSYELSFRFFTDDFEKAISNFNGKKILSNDENKLKGSDKFILDYILSDFSMLIDNNKIKYDFIGWEIKETVIWCYIEIKNISLTDKISVKNKLLIESFPNQKNLTTLINGNSKRSVIFSEKKTQAILYTK